MVYFFFSSRRRHTRFDCDWSSDVCSSDLHLFGELMDLEPDRRAGRRTLAGVLGARPAKWLLVVFLAAEAVLIWTSARDPWLAAFLAASAARFAVDGLPLWGDRPYSPGGMRPLFFAWHPLAL